MNKLIKKIVSVATALTVAAMIMAPAVPAQALTTAELQTLILDLQQQLVDLTAQLAATIPGGITPPSGTSIPACSGITFSRNLAVGSTGSDVMCLQALLNSNASTQVAVSGVGSPGNETLYFGNLSKGGVVKFQNVYASEVLTPVGLTAGTGFFGPSTRAKANSLLVTTPIPGPGPGPGPGSVVPTGAGLSVALSSDNPISATIVADTTPADGAQSMIPMIKLQLTNGDSSEVKITSISLKRGGISADADISQAYLYEGDTQLAEYQSFSSSVLTFQNSSGIISIPAGGTKVVTLKIDLANSTGSGKTMSFSVVAASDIVTDASVVNGTYPLAGNLMSTATTGDLGRLAVATSTNPALSIDPGDGIDVFNFTLAASDQDLEVRKIKVTNTGSTDSNDLVNLKLYDGATQIGNTIAMMDADKTVTFDLSGSPLEIDKGITKAMHVKADIVGGTNRTFQMGIQELTDIVVYDTQYGVFIKADKADSWTIYVHTASTISTGKLTVTRAADSPSGNIALGATNISVAKYVLKAEGEDVKITALDVQGYGGVGTDDLYQVKVIFDGAQKGTTDASFDTASSAGTSNNFTFGNTFIVPADGQEHTLEIKTDVKKGNGSAYSGGETLTIKLASFTAKGKTSSASVTVATAFGFQVTISTGTITAAKNNAFGNWSSTNPTGVRGGTEVLIGSFVVTAGASEGSQITAIAAEWTTTTNDTIQNMKLYKGTKETGTQIGSVRPNIIAGTDYTFYPSPYIEVVAAEQFTINVYADILNNDEAGDSGLVTLEVITGVGLVTNITVDSAGGIAGQISYVSGAGVLNASKDAGSPAAALVTMGTTGVEFVKVKYSASTSPEDILVTSIVATTSLGGSAPTTTIKNIRITADGLDQTLTALDDNGIATFDLSGNPWVIEAGTEPVLTLSADINISAYASSGASITMSIATTTYKGAMSGTPTDIAIASETTGSAMTTYKSQPTVAAVAFTSAGLNGGTIDIYKFSITADAGADINLYGVNLGISMFDWSTTSGDLTLQDLTLYDVSDLAKTALNDRGLTATGTATTYNTTTTLSSINFGAANDLNSKVGNIRLITGGDTATTVMDVIPAGQTVTYAVRAIVAGYDSTNDKLNVTVDNIGTSGDDLNAITWGDSTDVSINSNQVKYIPTDTKTTE